VSQGLRVWTRVRASRLRWSVSGRVWRYFWVVWIWAWPMRSMTDWRSAPPASSQEAWACLRSWTRTGKSMPLALTAGSQVRVRNVFLEIGVPALVGNSRSSCLMPWTRMCSAILSSQGWRRAAHRRGHRGGRHYPLVSPVLLPLSGRLPRPGGRRRRVGVVHAGLHRRQWIGPRVPSPRTPGRASDGGQ
jgi:hypothetical protein